jgi:hypothetical protein
VGVKFVRDLLLLLMVGTSSDEDSVPGLETKTAGADVLGERKLLELGLAVGTGFNDKEAAPEAVAGTGLGEVDRSAATLFAGATIPVGCC